ncbi:hypothetical protein C2E23DRAFT_691853, partial [Lenzites betulinus]
TSPAVQEVKLVYPTTPAGLLGLFGPIDICQTRTVTIGDALRAVYDFFQTPLLDAEAKHVERTRPDVWKRCEDAFKRRVEMVPHALPAAEWRRGMRRVDCLGEQVKFWGAWATMNIPGATWQINLGLV